MEQSEHRDAIKEHGLCRYHRKSFNIYAAITDDNCLPVIWLK